MISIKELLDFYSSIQEVEVVYRPNERVNWGRNRKMYDGKCDLEYNHRSILDNEVVFDFDSEDQEENLINANNVCLKLTDDKIPFALYHTGNKGYHIHTFWDLFNIKDRNLMKRVILKYYAYGMKIDYQLAGKHLVRMEGGINEKKRGNNKTLMTKSNDYLPLVDGKLMIMQASITPEIFTKYQEELNAFLARRVETTTEVEDEIIKELLDGNFIIHDGREKFMFYLINALKEKIPQQELADRISIWYAYSGGTKISRDEIYRKVDYHCKKGVTYPMSLKYLMKIYGVKKKDS